jgi:hypothetical protein
MDRVTIPFADVADVIARAKTRGTRGVAEKNLWVPQDPVSIATGFHVYADLDVPLSLSAAESDSSAQLFLRIISEFAEIGEAGAAAADARLLEVQGERLHFLLEADQGSPGPDPRLLGRLFALSRAIILSSYERIAPLSSVKFACRIAADYGPAVLLYASCGGGSVVSLGPAANTPAKRLATTPSVKAGCLAVPASFLPAELRGKNDVEWVEVDMRSPSPSVLEFSLGEIEVLTKRYLKQNSTASTRQFPIASATSHYFETFGQTGTLAPVRLQGFCLRADLDGFSAEVQKAFSNGGDAITKMIGRFRQILDFPSRLALAMKGFGRVVELPWAGDCATVLIIPGGGDAFSQARSYLPIVAALEWHKAFASDPHLLAAAGSANWALGVAAGDEQEGNCGQVLVADLPSSERTFRVVAGWGPRRSSDGYQYQGVRGGDTVLTRVDHRHLAPIHSEAFSVISDIFTKASVTDLHHKSKERVVAAGLSLSPGTVGSRPIPSAKPFGHQHG